jgi:hypothetical protein
VTGFQIEHVLDLIDSNISLNMVELHPEILRYLRDHADRLALEISERGYGEIPTRAGSVRISREDMGTAAA